MTDIDFTLTPLKAGIQAGRDHTLTVLVRARAPEAVQTARKPLNLALVIDKSGSMSGPPLHEAKRCAEHIVRGLSSSDTASIIAYDDTVEVLAKSGPVSDRRELLRAIRAIEVGGMTALYDGWRIGADQALFSHDRETLSRVLLLSDGNANRGLTDIGQIAKRVESVARDGVTTSTYGLGHHFNEDLMLAMGRAGGGNSYYGESAEDLMDPFQEELDLMHALYARRLTLTVDAPRGVKLRVLNDYPQPASDRWRLPDLAAGGEAWALLELCIPKRATKKLTHLELGARLKLKLTDGGRAVMGPRFLEVPVVSESAWRALPEDETVQRRAQEVRAAELQEEARQAALCGDWKRVDEILAIARRESADNPWVENALNNLTRYARQRQTEVFAKEARYSSHRMRSRLAAVNEVSGDYDPGVESNKPTFLRRKQEQGKRMPR
jgi:Ca-activated chloride channel family protein